MSLDLEHWLCFGKIQQLTVKAVTQRWCHFRSLRNPFCRFHNPRKLSCIFTSKPSQSPEYLIPYTVPLPRAVPVLNVQYSETELGLFGLLLQRQFGLKEFPSAVRELDATNPNMLPALVVHSVALALLVCLMN